MPHQRDPFGRILGPGTGSHPISFPLINNPPPGDADTGGSLGGILRELIPDFFRFPRLPPRPGPPRLPPGPGPPGPGRGPGPFPIPFPFPTDLFNGEGGARDCPGCCKGFHIAKTKDPNSPSFGQCVRNRSMNSLNPRALRRATRRLKGFERAVKSTRKQLRTLARI